MLFRGSLWPCEEAEKRWKSKTWFWVGQPDDNGRINDIMDFVH